MANVKIKGRNEPIFISNERAQKIKILIHGDPRTGTPAAPGTDRIDLGDWAGEISRIADISFDAKKQDETVFSESDLAQTEKEILTFKEKKFPPMPGGVQEKRLVTSFEFYCESRMVARIDQYGYMTITEVAGYEAIASRYKIIMDRKSRRDYGLRQGQRELAKKLSVKTA